MIDVLFVAFNRRAYTREAFSALIENTDWSLVDRLFVKDDGSADGTREWLLEQCLLAEAGNVSIIFDDARLGGPVAAMNWYLDQPGRQCVKCGGTGTKGIGDPPQVCYACDGRGHLKTPDIFAKIDNDFVVCPGWLNALSDVMSHRSDIDVLGVEPWFGNPVAAAAQPRTASDPVAHVGGKGLIRRRIFSQCRPQPGGFNGYQGWTQYQQAHPDVVKAWVTPDLPCFGLDQLEEGGPWRALAEGYAKKGWGRLWPPYGDPAKYTSWWTPKYGPS